MQSVVFGQKLKKGCLITLLSFVFVVPIVGSFGVPNVVYAQGTDASQFVPANAPANTPPATPANATNESDKGVLDQAIDGIKAGFAGAVNLLMITFVQIIMKFIEFLAFLFSFAIGFLQTIIKYNDYATQREVSIAWAIVRDSINSFFIVVLIAIAISTIIRFQPYNFRSTLPRLILAALLVNFSKAICLLAISFANSVMLTFSDALIEILPVYALGLRLPALTALDSASIGGIGGGTDVIDALAQKPLEILNILVATVLGAVMMMFALGGFAMFVIILLFRIIVLWFLIILSPLAFFLWGVPGRGASYWGQWLEEFVKHLIVGPIGAFFLYIIALFYVYNVQNSYGFTFKGQLPEGAVTVASSPQILIGYFVSLGMMFIALEIIEQLGVRGGQFAKQVGIDGIAKGAYAKTLARGVGAVASYANDFAYSKGLPSYRGTGLAAIREGWSDRRQEWVKKGKALDTKRAVEYAEQGAQFRSMLAAVSGGNVEYFKKNGALDVMSHIGKAPGRWVQGLRGKVDTAQKLEDQVRAADSTDAALNYVNALANSNPAVAGLLSQTSLAEIKSYDSTLANSTISNLADQITSRRSAAQGTQANFAQQISAKQREIETRRTLGASTRTEEQELAQLQTASQQADQQATTEIAQLSSNMESLVAQDRAMQEAKSFFEAKGLGMNDNETVADFTARAGSADAKSARTKSKLAAQEGLVGISKDVSTARGGLQGTVTQSMREYMSGSYEKDVRYSKEDLVARAKSNSNFGDRFQLGGDLLKAAEQGLFDDLVVELMGDPNYVVDQKGIKKFVETKLMAEAGMTNQEAMQVLVEIEGRNRSDNKISQTGIVKRYGGGRLDFTSEAEHHSAVKKSLDKKDVLSILQKSRPDGLGHKENGKLVFNKGVLEALKAKQSNLSATIENRNQRTTIDEATLRMLREAHDAGELPALSNEAVARLREI